MLVLGDPRPWGGDGEAQDLRHAIALLRHHRVIGLDPGAAEQAEGLLSMDEHARAAQFRDAVLRATFVAAHAVLRGLLSAGRDASAPCLLDFETGPFGKPRLPGPQAQCFSLSYRPGVAAIALSDRPVGIDVERVRPELDVAGIGQRFFTAPEREYLRGAAGQERLRRFYELWTRKEALVKAAGVGLNALQEASTVESLARLRDEAGVDRHYRLRQLQAAAGHAMALAVQCAEPNQGASPA